MGNLEVEQQTKWKSCQFQIREQLGSVHGQEPLDAFDFDDNEVFDDEVDCVGRRDGGAVVDNWHPHLAPKLQRGSREFIGQTFLVHTLEQAHT